jgi:hypothetical protein
MILCVHHDVTPAFYVGIMSLPMQRTPDVVCTMCDDDLTHCHGTALVMDNGAHVCSDDPDCTLSIDAHWFVSLEVDEDDEF